MKLCLWCGQEMLTSAQDFCGLQCNVDFTSYTQGTAPRWGAVYIPVPPPNSPLRSSKPGLTNWRNDNNDESSDPPDEYSLYINKMEDGITKL
jgi:hypothetical protein